MPSNIATPIPPQAPDLSKIKLIDLRFRDLRLVGDTHPAAGQMDHGGEERAAVIAAATTPRS